MMGCAKHTSERGASTVVEPMPSDELATLCHDLRSPLTTIAGALCVLEDALGPDAPPYARRSFEAGMRAIDRMTDMLAALETGKVDGRIAGPN